MDMSNPPFEKTHPGGRPPTPRRRRPMTFAEEGHYANEKIMTLGGVLNC
jgi:hypothetical protein